jgi:hypothetical protein
VIEHLKIYYGIYYRLNFVFRKMASSIQASNWERWLIDHPTNTSYDANHETVLKLCNATDPKVNFKNLCDSKNVALLTRAPIGGKMQFSFFHSVVGLPILPDEHHYVARLGITGSSTELDIASIFRSTSAIHVPTLMEMLEVKTREELMALEPNTTASKKKARTFSVLTPTLTKNFVTTSMAPADLFLKVTEHIGGSITVPTGTTPTSEADLLKQAGKPYEHILRTLWTAVHDPDLITAPTTAPLTDAGSMAWERTTERECISANLTTATMNPNSSPPHHAVDSGAITAMTKLSESIIKSQEAAAKNQLDRDDNRKKSWKKLPKIQQDILLLGGVEEDGHIPTVPTEEMLSILGCQNGAQVDQFLRQSMARHNMTLEPGFCTALNKGILVCPNDTLTPRNLTPFLTPPQNDDDEGEENANLLKLAVQEKFESHDLTLLTKMDITTPVKTQDLREHIKNFAGLAGRIFGQSSMLHINLREVADHIDDQQIFYNFEFRQDKFFGGTFLDKLNWRVHRFLDSCASGDPAKIDSKRLEFKDMMDEVERREYNSKTPAWIQRLIKKSEQRTHQGDGFYDGRNGGGGGNGPPNNEKKRRQFDQGGEGRNRKIQNPHKIEAIMLRPDEQLKDIFHPGNVRNAPRPKLKSGYYICTRYHGLGFCYTDCRASNGHAKLSTEEAESFKQFLQTARSNRTLYNNKRAEGTKHTQREHMGPNTQAPTEKGSKLKTGTGTPPPHTNTV